MKTIQIPYYTSHLDLHVAEENLKAVIYSGTDEFNAGKTEKELVEESLANPIGSPRLRELARGKKKVTLITSDHTRAVPSKLTLPILLKEIREGSPDADITILIATGLHRPTTEEEQRRMFGDEIVDNEKIVVNKAFEKDQHEFVCTLPSGAELWVNKAALDCDLLVSEGFIEPHFFAGFSGGRKSVLPGICNAATVNENHSYKAIASPFSTTGVLEHNPIHEDMVYAARAVHLAFILNVALNSEKKVIASFAGDMEEAHEKGVEFVRSLAQCPGITGDIVVTSNGGYPLDQNLYQSPKAVATAEACCKDGGTIIMCCSCVDGMGGTHFEKLIVMGTIDEIDSYLSKIPPKESISEQWCAQIYSRILKKHRVILVTTYLDHDLVRKANMFPASTPDEALEMAYEMMGKDAKVVVIPDGVSVLAVKEENPQPEKREEPKKEVKLALRVDDLDNVATIFANDVTAGTEVEVQDKKGNKDRIVVHSDIPYGHKIAVTDIAAGEHIMKYGESIGQADVDIKKGDYVHVHNMKALRGRGDL